MNTIKYWFVTISQCCDTAVGQAPAQGTELEHRNMVQMMKAEHCHPIYLFCQAFRHMLEQEWSHEGKKCCGHSGSQYQANTFLYIFTQQTALIWKSFHLTGLHSLRICSPQTCLREQQNKSRQKPWIVNMESRLRESLSSPCTCKLATVPSRLGISATLSLNTDLPSQLHRQQHSKRRAHRVEQQSPTASTQSHCHILTQQRRNLRLEVAWRKMEEASGSTNWVAKAKREKIKWWKIARKQLTKEGINRCLKAGETVTERLERQQRA